MNRDRNRKSRFGPPNNMGSTRMSNFAASNLQSARNINKTPEQIAFDKEFEKWEKSFEDWKKSFANHPDRNAYRQYESKFLEVRYKLIAKRKQIYDSNPKPSNAISIPFQNELTAADAMANSILSRFGDSGRRNDNFRSGGGSGGNFRNNQINYQNRSQDRLEPGIYNYACGPNQNLGRDNFNNRRFNDQNFGRNHDRGNNFQGNRGKNFQGFVGNNFRGGRNDRQGSGRNNFQGGRRNDRFKNYGGQTFQKPSEAQIEKELKRRDVYPFNKWELCGNVDRPELVGKRAKKKNAKILNYLEKKRKIENGEIPLEELPFSVRIEKLFEIAKNAECPSRLPGSSCRKLKAIRAKNMDSLTADERKLLAYGEYVNSKRAKYFEQKKLQEEATQKAEEVEGMEGVSEAPGEEIENEMDSSNLTADQNV